MWAEERDGKGRESGESGGGDISEVLISSHCGLGLSVCFIIMNRVGQI